MNLEVPNKICITKIIFVTYQMEKMWEEDYLNTNAQRENELIQY